jgi:hypothetical protein
MKKLIYLFVMAVLVSGCASVSSDFGSLTSVKYPPKSEQQEVLLLTSMPNRPYKEIGIIRVVGKVKTPMQMLNDEMLKKAREVGADAVINIQYGGGDLHGGFVGGSMLMLARRREAQGTAIVFFKADELQPLGYITKPKEEE